MTPRLVATSGSIEGTTYPLDSDLPIGRDPSNALVIDHRSVSRRHCIVQRDGSRFKISDLGSANGTFVNGVPANGQFLDAGDRLKIGQCEFVFLEEEEAPPEPETVELDDGSLTMGDTVVLRREDARYLQLDAAAVTEPRAGRMAQDLKTLLGIGSVLPAARELEGLARQLLESILEAVPADHGAILLTRKGPDEIASLFSKSRSSKGEGRMQLSRTVLDRVLREGVAVCSNDVQKQGLGASASLLRAQVSSVMAVPLTVGEKVTGAIYLDTTHPMVRFDDDHLQLLTGVAGIAAGALENALHVENLESENRRLKSEINLEHNMVGQSPRMRAVYDFVAKVAPTGSTALIRGESGTGKELAARAIHRNSPRSSKPFVAINCAALTETLLESEMFGHEKGAFTGAVVQKKGKLEEAAGGSVFLDEVGELALTLQAKLLRVLQEREFERVGGTRPIKADIRLIAATNRDLEDAVKAGAFRQDLYYRLNVVSLTMPPLRERREDIVPLAAYFAQKHARSCGRQIAGLSEEARACLMSYDWPGNVRELENVIERAVVLGSTETILADDLPEQVAEVDRPAGGAAGTFHDLVKEAKKQVVLKALEQTGGNYAEAAKLLGLHPNNLHRLIRSLNLRETVKK